MIISIQFMIYSFIIGKVKAARSVQIVVVSQMIDQLVLSDKLPKDGYGISMSVVVKLPVFLF